MSKVRKSNPLDSVVSGKVWRWNSREEKAFRKDMFAREEPLEIRLRGRAVCVTMRTPGHDEELAAGFLFTEGVIRNRDDVSGIAQCRQGESEHQENTLNVFLKPSIKLNWSRLTRHFPSLSSCGLCGRTSIESIHQLYPPVVSRQRVGAGTLYSLPKKLRAAQRLFKSTGGSHAAGIFDREGQLIAAREDVGRHNAVDKVIGNGFLGRTLPFENRILLVSGRASFEIMQKALAARISIVAAVSAPSSLAVEFAIESGQTLVGFLRGGGFQVYSHKNRVTGST